MCGECLVGKTIPAFRESTGCWQMGEVEAFDWKNQHHYLRFEPNNTRESLLVSSRPFDEYVDTVKRAIDDRRKRTRTEAETDAEADPAANLLLCSPARGKSKTGDHLVFQNDQYSFASEDFKVRRVSQEFDTSFQEVQYSFCLFSFF